LLTLTLALAAALVWRFGGSNNANPSTQQAFWRPLSVAARSPILVIGQGKHWNLSGALLRRLEQGPKLPASVRIEPGDLLEMDARHLSFENTAAAMNLAVALNSPSKRLQLRAPNQVLATDITEHPLIFLGAFNNVFTMNVMPKFRYRFEILSGVHSIVDSKNPERVWHYSNAPLENVRQSQDYAMLARLQEPSGALYYIVAGIQSGGTFAASEFATRPAFWKQIAEAAPRGWETGNVQIVLKTNVADRVAQSPEIVATHFWR
jgi:hypothetical protein